MLIFNYVLQTELNRKPCFESILSTFNDQYIMKTSHHVIFLLLSTALFLTACSEDQVCDEGIIEVPNTVALLDGAEYAASIQNCRLPRVQRFSFQAFEGGTFRGPQDTEVFVPPQSIFNDDGEPVDALVTLELIEMYEPGEIIACQLSTNGLSTTAVQEPLLSEGIYYINLSLPGVNLNLANDLQVFSPSTNAGLSLFQFNSLSCQEIDCSVLWEANAGVEVLAGGIENPDGTVTEGYRTFVRQLGWISVARYNPDDSVRTIIYNKAPVQFNGSNSNTFLLYEGNSTGIAMFDRYDSSLDVFSEMHGQIPTGTDGHFILVTVQDGAYRFATQSTTIDMDQIGLTTQTSDVTETAFINSLNALQ